MFIIKFFLYFFVSFIILSFPVGKLTVFHYAHKYTKPITNEINGYISKNISVGYHHTKKFFYNYFPREDQVKSKLSGIKKETKPQKVKVENEPLGQYTVEEKQMLEKILNSASSN